MYMLEGYLKKLSEYFKFGKLKLVYVGLFLANIKQFCSKSHIIPYTEMIDDVLSVLILGIFLLVILKQTFTYKQLIVYGIISVLTIYSAFVSGYMIIAITVLTILAIRQENVDDIAVFLFKCKSFFLGLNTIVVLLFWGVGIAEISTIYEAGTRERIHFGYGMPAHFANYILDLIVLWLWLKHKKAKTRDYILLSMVSIVTYLCTDSRVIFVVSLMLILGSFGIKKTKIFNRLLSMVTKLIIPLVTGVMFLIIYLFAKGSSIAYAIDAMLNTRIRLNGYRLEQYGLTLFGQYCANVSEGYNPVWMTKGGAYDNTYMWLCINMGAIWLIILGVCFYKLSKMRRPLLNLLLIVWALAAVVDTDFLNGMSTFIILLMTLVLDKNKIINEGHDENSAYNKTCNI